ncbi:MAG: hypothetical protein WC858_00955 [Parcubacteria group bacterium]
MEKNPVDSEDKNEASENGRENMKVWLQENLRMIISVLIVVIIAGGIYSYSKRTQNPVSVNEKQEVAQNQEGEGKISVIGGDSQNEAANSEENAAAPAPSENQQVQAETPSVSETPAETSKETEASFVETAVKGDGSTNLARRALANYLEKNPDASLTVEHKIYIEDYLRRQVPDGRLKIGDTREFSKDMVNNAIQKSKILNENQLKNLKKFADKVPGLS